VPDEARLIAAFLLALGAAFAVTPAAIAVAGRTDFHDRPVGYKGHSRPTPYLGGAAVLGGFLVAATLLGGEFARLSPIVACTCALWALGTLDDRLGLGAWSRVVAECIAAMVLWGTGLGWNVFPGGAADLALTVVWVVGLVNAFNLIDNMDGAAATVAAVTSVAVGGLALLEGDVALAILVFGLAGACLGFLPYNLASPARIFLGDGGSLPIGFVVAASLMAVPTAPELGFEHVLAATLLVGVPVLDTTLVSISRRRAGVSLWTGGRDHLTHRLQTRLGTARTVALSLGAIQAGLGAVAVGVVQLGRGSVLAAWSIWFVVVAAAIVLLETRSWAPAREPRALPARGSVTGFSRAQSGGGSLGPSPVEVVLIAFIAISCGLSPFLYGFYDVSVWGPIALGTLAALLGLLIARPAVPRPAALIAAAALVGLWLWALVSVGWSESADQAMTEANRWLLYAALFGVLVLLVSDDRLGAIVVGTGAAAILALGLYIAIRLVAGSGDELFFAGRLIEPLGYVNGQAGYLLMGVWPLVALAERARKPLVAGGALAGATFLGALVLLGQTRAVLPAAGLSALLLLLVVPGRTKRAWALAVAGAGIAVCAGPVLDVYDSVRGGSPPADGEAREAALAVLLASAAAGAVWAGTVAVVGRMGERTSRAGRFAWAPLAVGAVLVLAVAVAALEDPVSKVRDEYRGFVELEDEADNSSRFASGGGNRYDYWRIAVDQFADNPVRGIGAGNYDRTYFLERRTTEDVRQAHSIELQTLGELGVVGGMLLAAFLIAIGTGFARRARAAKDDPRARALAVAAGGTFAVWLVHTSVDWLHLIPGLTGIALCSAAVLVGPWRGPRTEGAGRARVAVVAICGIAVLVGAVLVGRTALADRYLNEGREVVASDPPNALAKADDSQRLNDERLAAYYLESAAWARLGDYRRARAALSEATRREPHDFVTWALLGDLATRRGEDRQALRDYRRALSLNPRNETLQAAVRDARARVLAR
jgi:UDP-N-acetylmuramyl pentapeptide phosphotransferase/UDP-N-acetylglucosamine-1-phosphate transferase/tetratricopeptide (TPR) repeat protein